MIDEPCVAKGHPVIVGGGSARILDADGQRTVGDVRADDILVTSCAEGTGRACHAPGDETDGVACDLIQDGLVAIGA